MNERVRAALLGLGLGVAPLLLLDLARILDEAVVADGGRTSVWWPVACYVATGVVAAVGIGVARGERLVPGVAAAVLVVATLPTVPLDLAARLPAVPLVPGSTAAQAVALALAGAYLAAAVRGARR